MATVELHVTDSLTMMYTVSVLYDYETYSVDTNDGINSVENEDFFMNHHVVELLDKYRKEDPNDDYKVNKIIVLREPVEFNLFDGTGFHYENMKLTVALENGTCIVNNELVEGYHTVTYDSDDNAQFIYSFAGGYLFILHDGCYGYGSSSNTEIVIALGESPPH